MEYILLLGAAAEAFGSNMKMGLQTAYDKIFEHPWLLALVCGGAILLALWAMKTSK